jgi:hypothetical protein
MVRPGRDRLNGRAGVSETYVGTKRQERMRARSKESRSSPLRRKKMIVALEGSVWRKSRMPPLSVCGSSSEGPLSQRVVHTVMKLRFCVDEVRLDLTCSNESVFEYNQGLHLRLF